MTKIQIKSEKLTLFGGIFSIMEHFDALLSETIDSTLGLRCKCFGWNRMPKSFMSENAVFPVITALIYNFYRKIMKDDRIEHFGLKKNNRIKAFVFKFISVPTKWIRK